MNDDPAEGFVLVTRPAEDAGPWVDALERRGRRALVYPCLAIEPIETPDLAARLRGAVGGAAVLALTSPRAVRRAAELLDAPPPATVRIAVVGAATAAAARAAFGRVDIEPAAAHGRALAARLAGETDLRAGDRVVAPCADRARRDLEDALTPRGVEVIRLPVYRTVPVPPRTPRDDLRALGASAALLASPSAVEGLAHRARGIDGVLLVSIGPTTSGAIRARGWQVAAEATRPGIDGLLDALERADGARASSGRSSRRA